MGKREQPFNSLSWLIRKAIDTMNFGHELCLNKSEFSDCKKEIHNSDQKYPRTTYCAELQKHKPKVRVPSSSIWIPKTNHQTELIGTNTNNSNKFLKRKELSVGEKHENVTSKTMQYPKYFPVPHWL